MATLKSENLLFRLPSLYEFVYPEAGSDTQGACRELIERFAPGTNLRILDIGCGTGRVIARLVEMGHEGMGIDVSIPMIEFAKKQNPALRIQYGDMRSFDLGEKFHVLICVGSTFTYNLTNDQVHSSLESFRKHLEDGGLLILDMLNASRFLNSEMFRERVEQRVSEDEFHALAISRHFLDRRKQSFRRIRTWQIDGQDKPVVDHAEYRLFFPLELENYLSQHHFSTLGIWDNKELEETDLTGRRLYLAAQAI